MLLMPQHVPDVLLAPADEECPGQFAIPDAFPVPFDEAQGGERIG
jgi:hypothetical protein